MTKLDQIWYRESSHNEKTGPFSLQTVSDWYENSRILPSAEFSADGGKTWRSIVDLRRRNGPVLPFLSFDDVNPPGKSVMDMAREKVANARSHADRIEKEMESMLAELKEDEKMLEKLSEMDMMLDSNSCNEAEQGSSEEMDEDMGEVIVRNVNPINVLHPIPAPDGQDVVAVVKRAASELSDAFKSRHPSKFRAVAGNAFGGKMQKCEICNLEINNLSKLIRHVMGPDHVKMMIKFNLTYRKEPLAFWMRALRTSQLERYSDLQDTPEIAQESREKMMSEYTTPEVPESFPPSGVDPFALLDSCAGARRKLQCDVTVRFKQLLACLMRCDRKKMDLQMRYIIGERVTKSCCLCEAAIHSASGLISHITCKKHINKMKSSVCADAFDFWWNAIQEHTVAAQRSRPDYSPNSLVREPEPASTSVPEPPSSSDSEQEHLEDDLIVETEEPRLEIDAERPQLLDRDQVMRIGDEMRSIMSTEPVRDVFLPRFFCPRAFRVIANAKGTALHEMNRVCSGTHSIDLRAPVPLVGPLAILDRCDDPARSVPDLKAALNFFRKRIHLCDRFKLRNSVMHIERLFQVNYDDYEHPSAVNCALCEVNIGSHWSMLAHVSRTPHMNKVLELGTSVDRFAYKYWKSTFKMCIDWEGINNRED